MKRMIAVIFTVVLAVSLSACGAVAEASGSQDLLRRTQTATRAGEEISAEAANEVTVRTFSSARGFSSEVHVLGSDKGNILIDPGFYDDTLAEYVESIGGLDAILITHGHWDNIHALDVAEAANPDAEIFMHELDYDFLRDPVLNVSAPNGFSLMVDTKPKTFDHEGMYDIGGYHFEVIHTPGHTCGGCCFYFEEENILFSGDMFMIPFVGSADHPTGNEADRAASIEKFLSFGFPDDLKIYPGHRGNTTYGEMLKTNVDLQ